MSHDALEQRMQALQPLFAEVWQALARCLEDAGLAPLAVLASRPGRSELREDPFDHSQALYAEWRSASGSLLGSILVNGNDQAFAEFDVLQLHPRKPRWVVEAATAWGTPGAIRSELRLLPALEP